MMRRYKIEVRVTEVMAEMMVVSQNSMRKRNDNDLS
jgi:hypothetical protein